MVSGKKTFSVPVGKLRSNTARCRNISSSTSNSRSKYQNRLLRKNNRELAYALAKQKERNKMAADENLRLTSSLHDSQLKVLGWKNKFNNNQKALSNYHSTVVNHIKDAVRYCVLLTESLKLAMTIPVQDCGSLNDSEAPSQKESQSSNSTLVSPLKHRVNPMISGHTIKYPTVNLKRLNVEVVERVTETNGGETSEKIMEFYQEPSAENSRRSSKVGLSTCIEEDEDESQSRNVTSTSHTEMHEDSFRRRTVSFRNRTLDKSKQMWDIEVADSSTNKLTGSGHENSPQLSSSRRNFSQRELYGEWECIAVPEGLDRLKPVVALNDVSKYMQYSNSVNVLEISKFADQFLSMASRHINSHEGEKENLPSNKIVPEPVKRKSNIQQAEESKAVRNEDPLEGTSWMYQNHFEVESKRCKRKAKDSKKPRRHGNKEINLNDKKTKTRNKALQSDSDLKRGLLEEDADSDFVKEKDYVKKKDLLRSEMPNDEPQEPPHDLEDQAFISQLGNNISYESLKIKDNVEKNLVVQSTPICSDDRSSSKDIVSPSVSHKLVSLDRSCSVSSIVLPELNNSRASNGDVLRKEMSPALVDAKLLCSAFVTVRVKKLNYQVDSEDEKQLVNDQEDEKQVNNDCEEKVGEEIFDDQLRVGEGHNGFLGFDSESMPVGKAKTMSEGINSPTVSSVTSRENSRTSFEVTCSSSKANGICDSSSSMDCGSRPKRKAAPTVLKEPKLNVKMRRETMGQKNKSKKRKPVPHQKEDVCSL